MKKVVLIDNPLAKHYLTILRDKSTPPRIFREYMRRVGFIMGYEVSKLLKWRVTNVETPLAEASGLEPEGKLLIIGVLGASIPLINGMWEALPWAGLGLIAAKRIESEGGVDVNVFYERIPDDLSNYTVIVADPMLATGSTMLVALDKIYSRGCRDAVVAVVIASRRGVELLHEKTDVTVVALAIDPELNDKFFIVPGLGDAGDRSLNYDNCWKC